MTELLLTSTDRVMGSRHCAFPQSTTLGSTLTIGPMVLAINVTVPRAAVRPCALRSGHMFLRQGSCRVVPENADGDGDLERADDLRGEGERQDLGAGVTTSRCGMTSPILWLRRTECSRLCCKAS